MAKVHHLAPAAPGLLAHHQGKDRQHADAHHQIGQHFKQPGGRLRRQINEIKPEIKLRHVVKRHAKPAGGKLTAVFHKRVGNHGGKIIHRGRKRLQRNAAGCLAGIRHAALQRYSADMPLLDIGEQRRGINLLSALTAKGRRKQLSGDQHAQNNEQIDGKALI